MKRITDEDRAIAARLREQRLLTGMSQEALGRQLGLTFQQVQKYELGQNRISAGKLAQAARILGVSITVFFEDDAGARRRAITRDEARLLNSFRRMPESEQEKVMGIARAVADAWDAAQQEAA